MLIRIVFAIEPAPLRQRVGRLLRQREVALVECTTAEQLWERLTREEIDLVVAGRSILSDSPERRVADIRKLPEHPEVIVLEDSDDPAARAALLAAGCLAVLHQEVPDGVLAETLRTLVQRRREDVIGRLAAERADRRYDLDDFVSSSPVMTRFISLARRVVQADSSLLILGETGVGKERLARAIHSEGHRSSGPFITVNLGALPETLLESELFGHEEGAFTGASRSRRGYFELAHRGTIFMDEIGEMPLHLQVRLLRVLEDRRIQRVGGERPIEIDVRIIAATNRDLEAEVRAGRFRTDLFFRLAVVTLTLPPLRERREDIPDLVRSYLDYFRVRVGRQVRGVAPEAMEALCAHSWPGNVRELINVVEQVVLLCGGDEVTAADLPHRITASFGTELDSKSPEDAACDLAAALALDLPLGQARREAIDAFERRYVARLLEQTEGRIGAAAGRAGISPRHLHDLMKRHGLRKETFKR